MEPRDGTRAERVRRMVRAALISVVLVIALFLGLTVLLRPASKNITDVPDLTIERLEGGTLALADLSGQPLVINLWATWCPPCRRELPLLQSMADRNPGVHFVFANQGEPRAVVASYLTARDDVSLRTVVLDRDGLLSADLNALGLPTTYFFDAKGHLAVTHVGEVSSVELLNYLTDLQR